MIMHSLNSYKRFSIQFIFSFTLFTTSFVHGSNVAPPRDMAMIMDICIENTKMAIASGKDQLETTSYVYGPDDELLCITRNTFQKNGNANRSDIIPKLRSTNDIKNGDLTVYRSNFDNTLYADRRFSCLFYMSNSSRDREYDFHLDINFLDADSKILVDKSNNNRNLSISSEKFTIPPSGICGVNVKEFDFSKMMPILSNDLFEKIEFSDVSIVIDETRVHDSSSAKVVNYISNNKKKITLVACGCASSLAILISIYLYCKKRKSARKKITLTKKRNLP